MNLTAGSDTVDATTNANTLSGATVIDSSASDRDVLNARLTTSATPTLVANVETINVDVAGFGVVLDVANVRYGTTGGAEVNLSTSQVGNTTASVTNVGSQNVNFNVGPSITTLNLTGTANGNDATRITAQGDLTVAHTTGTGVETVTFAGQGAARTITLSAGTGGTGREYIIDGSQNVNLAGSVGVFDARQVREAAGYAGTSQLQISSGGAGDLSNVQLDSIRLDAALGNNSITFRHNAVVNVNAASALNTATGTVGVGTGTGGAANTGTATTLNLVNNHASGMASGNTVTFGTGVDILNITANSAIGSGTGTGAAFTTITNVGGTAAQVNTINLVGSSAVNLMATTTGTGTTGDNLVINGVGLNAALTLTVASNAGNSGGTTILLPNVGSTASFSGAAATGNGATIIGGSGADTITGSVMTELINGGAGNDTITLSSGSDTIFGGAGADAFRITSGAANGTVISDFAKGTDRLVLQASGATLVNLSEVVLAGGGLSGITGFTSGVLSLQSGGSALSNTVAGTGDNWTDSIQLGRATGNLYEIASGTGGAGSDITAGNFADFIAVANAAAGTRLITMGSGDDWLNITGATGATGAATVTLGAGNDTININTDSSGAIGNGGVTTIKFEATAASNGNDTINGFSRGAQAGFYDVLDFRSFLGNAGVSSTKVYLGLASTGTNPQLAVANGAGATGSGAIDFTTGAAVSGSALSGGVAGDAGNDVFVIFDGTASLTSGRFVDGTTASAGKIAIAGGTKSVVLHQVGGVTSTVANIYYVENGTAAGLDDLVITQVGVVNFAAGPGNVFAENFTA